MFRDQFLKHPLLPWLVLMAALMGHFGVAGMRYVNVAKESALARLQAKSANSVPPKLPELDPQGSRTLPAVPVKPTPITSPKPIPTPVTSPKPIQTQETASASTSIPMIETTSASIPTKPIVPTQIPPSRTTPTRIPLPKTDPIPIPKTDSIPLPKPDPIPLPKTNPTLFVLIDTILLNEEREAGAWVHACLKQTVQKHRPHLSGGGAWILRNEQQPKRWDEKDRLGGEHAFDGSAVKMKNVFTQLKTFLDQDRGSGRVVVLWANKFPPKAEWEIAYPLPSAKSFVLLWMDGKDTSKEYSLFDRWLKDDFGKKYLVIHQFGPREIQLKELLDKELQNDSLPVSDE